MDEVNNRHICLKLADRSLYSLYNYGQAGERLIVLSPALENQDKNEISLFDCTGDKKILLRDILLENPGDMKLKFSLGQGYLSYRIMNLSGVLLDKGLIELPPEGEESDLSLDTGGGRDFPRERKRPSPRKGWVLFSVFLSLGILFFGTMVMVSRAERKELPPLITSEMPPR